MDINNSIQVRKEKELPSNIYVNRVSPSENRYSPYAVAAGYIMLFEILSLCISMLCDKCMFIFVSIYSICIVTGILTAMAALYQIRFKNTKLKGKSLAITIIIINMTICLASIGMMTLRYAQKIHANNKWGGVNGLYRLKDIVQKYAEINQGYLPDANQWCDSLIKDVPDLKKEDFIRPMVKGYVCNFAFNKNISGKQLKDIPQDVVMFFEADGGWNLSGERELLKKRENLDIYFILMNGRTYKYDFEKEGLILYDKDGKIEPPRWNP